MYIIIHIYLYQTVACFFYSVRVLIVFFSPHNYLYVLCGKTSLASCLSKKCTQIYVYTCIHLTVSEHFTCSEKPYILKCFIFQLLRTPRPFPTLTIKRTVRDIDDFVFGDFQLDGYNPHPKIKMVMAV